MVKPGESTINLESPLFILVIQRWVRFSKNRYKASILGIDIYFGDLQDYEGQRESRHAILDRGHDMHDYMSEHPHLPLFS